MTAVGTALTAVALVVAVGAWLKPRQAGADRPVPSRAPSSESVAGLFRTPWLGLEFWRGADRVQMVAVAHPRTAVSSRDVVRVSVGTQPFQIRLPKVPTDTAVQICGWIEDSIFTPLTDSAIGDVPFFRPGTGMADSSAGSGSLIVTNEAQNYFIGRRIASLSTEQDAIYVSSIAYPHWLSESSPPPLRGDTDVYLVIHVDLDRDDVIDIDEYEYVLLDR